MHVRARVSGRPRNYYDAHTRGEAFSSDRGGCLAKRWMAGKGGKEGTGGGREGNDGVLDTPRDTYEIFMELYESPPSLQRIAAARRLKGGVRRRVLPIDNLVFDGRGRGMQIALDAARSKSSFG